MRLNNILPSLLPLALLGACNAHSEARQRANPKQTNPSQNVTVGSQPEDIAFKDLAKNWRQFISSSPELTTPVVGTVKRETGLPAPVITSECAWHGGAYVPQMTIGWVEPITPEAATVRQAAQPETLLRFDLGLHYRPFERNYYSSILSTQKQQRFMLPSNSALAENPVAVLQTGAGLFPKLIDFSSQVVQDRATNRKFEKRAMVLRDLNPGISYTMRVSRRVGKGWNADRLVIFSTPVCPNSY